MYTPRLLVRCTLLVPQFGQIRFRVTGGICIWTPNGQDRTAPQSCILLFESTQYATFSSIVVCRIAAKFPFDPTEAYHLAAGGLHGAPPTGAGHVHTAAQCRKNALTSAKLFAIIPSPLGGGLRWQTTRHRGPSSAWVLRHLEGYRAAWKLAPMYGCTGSATTAKTFRACATSVWADYSWKRSVRFPGE